MNVVPGLPTEFTFKPIRSTEEMRAIKGDPEFDYYLVCNKICGNAHFNMRMKIVVEDQKSYDKWMNEQAGLFVNKEETENAETESTEEGIETVALN
jgi:cytochrome c oxidase subunit 2